MIEVTIVGGSGYTGGELIRLLQKHPKIEIKDITSRKYDKTPVNKVHPHIQGSDLVFKDIIAEKIDSDVIFTATPHGASMNIVPDLLETGAKVIDLSGDYRFRDISVYEKWYGIEHSGKIDAVYGLPEIYREDIKKAKIVANPGCFPTGAILANLPLSKNKLVKNIIIDSKTGVSGGGITPNQVFHYPNCADNVIPYKIISHRHSPEIQQELGEYSNVKVSFTPHLVPVIRGIITTSHSFLKDLSNNIINTKEDIENIREDIITLYKNQYKNEKFVKILDDDIPNLSSVRGSNFVHIGGFEIDENGRLVVISAIDNLVKGASGQAIQNMNLMCGFDEEIGIDSYGMRP
ncbi:N-acetyl-gamma-glutamyl-phosphate reductase [bioreactor metagenome]|uniref:N-acetyl-gamma-glutamyl-phosphate reductase n=1 Tax=bioreactor metagenome TaxID=1076179 RepID=A0A644X5L3_9ZZZZ|nr:N-acetyl-gamma-glutamyl-phosphate reductase [Methanobrevibacter sp.]MEA4957962.1 N-acetyl-gamma-glutamyl-phosphate reductase [Methanobrevibacter sp.]